MMKQLTISLLLCALPIAAQQDVGLFGVGSFNPTNFVEVQNNQQITQSTSSKAGGGAEYRYFLTPHDAADLLVTVAPSEAKLRVSPTVVYYWPLINYDLALMVARSFGTHALKPFMEIGPGANVNYGFKTSGWSAYYALAMGGGADYSLSKHWQARVGILFLTVKGGCYDDPTCQEQWGVAESLRAGFAYRWGVK